MPSPNPNPPLKRKRGKSARTRADSWVITKTSGRRLYYKRYHDYVRLEHFPHIVREKPDVKVTHRESGADITRHTFLEAVAELEGRTSTPALTTEFLTGLLLLEQSPRRAMLRTFLEETLRCFTEGSVGARIS